MSTQAEVRELEAHIRKAGYKIVRTGSGSHKKILTSKGAVVTDKNGPLILSGSPGEHRWREMHVQRLMDAGVLKSDPWKPTPSGQKQPDAEGGDGKKKGGGRADLQDPAIRERMMRAVQEKSAANKEQTAKLRARWEPILAKLGGWDNAAGGHRGGGGVSIIEFSEVMQHWAQVRGRVELPKKTQRGTPMNMGALSQITRNLKISGNTIGEFWMPLFKAFVDELEMKAGTPPDPAKAAARYIELLKEQKGISDGPQAPAAGPPTGRPEPLPARPQEPPQAPTAPVPVAPVFGPATMIKAPRLALETLYLLAKSIGADETRIMGIASEIAELELNREGGS